MDNPPSPFVDMDVVWPLTNRNMGANVTYVCPYRKGTFELQLKGCALYLFIYLYN